MVIELFDAKDRPNIRHLHWYLGNEWPKLRDTLPFLEKVPTQEILTETSSAH